MPAGDSKNDPHQKKSLLSSFSVGAQSQGNKTSNISSQWRQDTITQHNAVPAPLQRLSAHSQGKTRKKQQSKWFFLFLLRRGCPSLRQGKMMGWRARRYDKGAFSAPQRARWDNTTIKKEQ